MILKDRVQWDAEKMGSYPLEDYEKMAYPAKVVVRRQIDCAFFDIGKFKTADDLWAVMSQGLIVGPDQCDRVCYYKKGHD